MFWIYLIYLILNIRRMHFNIFRKIVVLYFEVWFIIITSNIYRPIMWLILFVKSMLRLHILKCHNNKIQGIKIWGNVAHLLRLMCFLQNNATWGSFHKICYAKCVLILVWLSWKVFSCRMVCVVCMSGQLLLWQKLTFVNKINTHKMLHAQNLHAKLSKNHI